jgi:hypothetical protein
VIGFDPLGNNYVATGTVEVRVFEPAINLEKTVSETLVPVGTTVADGFDVTNVGTSPLSSVATRSIPDSSTGSQLRRGATPARPRSPRRRPTSPSWDWALTEVMCEGTAANTAGDLPRTGGALTQRILVLASGLLFVGLAVWLAANRRRPRGATTA